MHPPIAKVDQDQLLIDCMHMANSVIEESRLVCEVAPDFSSKMALLAETDRAAVFKHIVDYARSHDKITTFLSHHRAIRLIKMAAVGLRSKHESTPTVKPTVKTPAAPIRRDWIALDCFQLPPDFRRAATVRTETKKAVTANTAVGAPSYWIWDGEVVRVAAIDPMFGIVSEKNENGSTDHYCQLHGTTLQRFVLNVYEKQLVEDYIAAMRALGADSQDVAAMQQTGIDVNDLFSFETNRLEAAEDEEDALFYQNETEA